MVQTSNTVTMPDLNTVPDSPHFLARRPSSQQMPPPPAVPSSPSLNVLPSNQTAVNQGTAGSPSPLPSPHFAPPAGPVLAENIMSGPDAGPVRHPRPYTAADIHQELEKEQEAVVNRLNRELSILRATQNASVASNTSSTSATPSGADMRRHHRTTSNTSARSFGAMPPSVSTSSIAPISSPAPVRPTVNPVGGINMSRQSSSTSRRSRAGSPTPGHLSSTPASLTQSHLNDPSIQSYFAHRIGPTSSNITSAPTSAPTATPGSDALSPSIIPGTSRYEETAFYRQELESAKRENEALRMQIRELERKLRDRRPSDANRPSQGQASQQRQLSRHRSESVSTTASVSVTASTTGGGATIAAQREERPRVVSMLSTASSVAVGVPEEEVRVGESASNAGLSERDG